MPKRRKNPGGGGRTGHPNSLANLRKGRDGVPGPGRPPSHGVHARLPLELVDERAQAIYAAMAEDAPWRDVDGGLPRHDRATVRLLAMASLRLERAEIWIAHHGWLDEKGRPRPVVELERRLRGECARLLDSLGMSPAARARMGFDLAASHKVAADLEAERRRRETDPLVNDPVFQDELKRLRAAERFALESAAEATPPGRDGVKRVSRDEVTTRLVKATEGTYARMAARREALREEEDAARSALRWSTGELPAPEPRRLPAAHEGRGRDAVDRAAPPADPLPEPATLAPVHEAGRGRRDTVQEQAPPPAAPSDQSAPIGADRQPEPAVGEVPNSGPPSTRPPVTFGEPGLVARDHLGREVPPEEIRAIKRRHGVDDGELPITHGLTLWDR